MKRNENNLRIFCIRWEEREVVERVIECFV